MLLLPYSMDLTVHRCGFVNVFVAGQCLLSFVICAFRGCISKVFLLFIIACVLFT